MLIHFNEKSRTIKIVLLFFNYYKINYLPGVFAGAGVALAAIS